MNNFFYPTAITVSDKLISRAVDKINAAQEEDWKIVLQMTLIQLPLEFFNEDPELYDIIKILGAEGRIAVYKTPPNTSYFWHKDSTRNASINILLSGYDSMTLYAKSPSNGMMSDLTILPYKEKKVFLLNTQELHTVMNFSETRYILSVGIPRPTTFEEAKQLISSKTK